MSQFKILEHTADVRLKVFGKDLKELLENALKGLMAIIAGEENLAVSDKKSVIFEIFSSDREGLLIDFLNEALYFIQTEKKLIAGVNFYELKQKSDGFFLRAEFLLADSGKIVKDVKAATYHDLKISQNNGQLEATITLDI
ncbi:MAG: archease [Patescibacteria group bacterium]